MFKKEYWAKRTLLGKMDRYVCDYLAENKRESGWTNRELVKQMNLDKYMFKFMRKETEDPDWHWLESTVSGRLKSLFDAGYTIRKIERMCSVGSRKHNVLTNFISWDETKDYLQVDIKGLPQTGWYKEMFDNK